MGKDYSIFDNMLEGCQIISHDWRYLYVNDAASKQCHVSRENLLGKTVMEVYPGIEETKMFSNLQRSMNERVSLSMESEFTFPGGNRTYFESRIEPVPEGIFILSLDISKRKKTEDALKESKEIYRQFFNNPLNGFALHEIITDDNGNPIDYRFLEVNATFEDFTGLKREKIIYKRVKEIFPSEEVNELIKSYGDVALKGGFKHFEYYVPSLAKYYDIAVFSPQKMRFITFFTDITERKKAEDALKKAYDNLEKMVKKRTSELEEAYDDLKKSEKKFRGIFDNATDMISLIRVEGDIKSAHYIEINNAGIERLGYSREEMLNMGPFDIDEGPETHEHVEKLLKEGHARFETIHVTKDMRRIPVDVNVHFMNYGGIKAALEIVRDISKRKEAEERINQLVRKLRESEANFRSLAENSPNLIIRINRELNYLYVNPTIKKFTSQSPEFFIGKNLEEIETSEEYKSIWREKYSEVLKTGKIQNIEFEFPTVIGLKFFKIVIIPEYNDKGEIETALSISIDITERKEAEKKLEVTIGELKRSNDELQSFAYVASHDLQEPLRTISSFTQLLERRYGGKLDSDADEFIEYVVEAAQRMQQMIHDLLDYSRIMTKGKEFEEVSIEDTLQEVMNSLKAIIDENNAVITHDKLPTVTADSGQLLRVFQNLIVNAIKFRKPDEPPRVHISANKDEKAGEYIFSVSDNGIGIEEQYFDRIFTIFQRLHTRTEYQGTGIGLSLVKRIIERHGGQMRVESKYGVGSTFYFTIPFKI